MNTETNTSSFMDECGSTTRMYEHSNKNCTFQRLVLERVRGTHTTTRHSRTPLPPQDTGNTDDRCFPPKRPTRSRTWQRRDDEEARTHSVSAAPVFRM